MQANISTKQKQRRRNLISNLKNNTYKQGYEQLYDEDTDTYCIGGVLIDIYMKQTNNGFWQRNPTGRYTSAILNIGKEQQHYCITIPKCVLDWYGFSNLDMIDLIDKNDTEHTFTNLATYIQKSL